MMLEFVNMAPSTNFFQVVVSPLSNFLSKFPFNIITGSGVMTIFVYNELTRNLKIANNRVQTLPYNWGQGRARDSKFDTNVSNKKLLNATKCHGSSFYRF